MFSSVQALLYRRFMIGLCFRICSCEQSGLTPKILYASLPLQLSSEDIASSAVDGKRPSRYGVGLPPTGSTGFCRRQRRQNAHRESFAKRPSNDCHTRRNQAPGRPEFLPKSCRKVHTCCQQY
uniref:Uncharacterized protein n=1 Tax=Anopheles culicifacies TaxID=139723 RepID=A0A182LT96_9DIPT